MTQSDAAAQVAQTLGDLLLRANREHLYDVLTAGIEGLDATTYPVLSGLARTGFATATQLADAIGLDRTVTTRHATRLAAAGLLARREHPSDARATELVLTPQGRRAIGRSRTALRRVVATAMAGWSATEVMTFARLFDELSEGIATKPP